MNKVYSKINGFLLAMICCLTITLSISNLAVAGEASKGVNTDYHTQEEINAYVRQSSATITDGQKYDVQYSLQEPVSPGVLSDSTLQGALDIVNQIRYIAGLPEVTLDRTYNEKSQIAALIGAMNRGISHSPSQPAGMPKDMYDIGYSTCGESNLSMGRRSLNYSIVDGFMGDYSGNNVPIVGHRRWILNPDMGKTGFGAVETSYVMYAFDQSAASANGSYSGVAWPARQMPLDFFASESPWSYSYGSSIGKPENVKVNLVETQSGKEWNFSSEGADGDFYVNNGWYAKPGCIIFRPNSATYRDGMVYKVTISGLPIEVEYTVSFFKQSVPTKEVKLGENAEKLGSGEKLYYKFTAPYTGIYSFYSSAANNFDTYGEIYPNDKFESGTAIASNDDIGSGNLNFGIKRFKMSEGETVYLVVRGYSSLTSGNFILNVTCDEILELPAINFSTASLAAEDLIGLNVNFKIPASLLADKGAYLYMTYDGQVTAPQRFYFKDAKETASGYMFTFPVAIAEIYDKVQISAFTGDGQVIPMVTGDDNIPIPGNTFKYAVSDVLNRMLKIGSAKDKALARAMLDYGSAAGIYFDYNPTATIVADLSGVTSDVLAPYKIAASGAMPAGLSFSSYSLELKSETSLRSDFKFNDSDFDKYTFTCNGEKVTPIRTGVNAYSVKIEGIVSVDLDTTYTISVTDGTKTLNIGISALTYAYNNVNKDEKASNLVKAMYLYNQVANLYFEK